MTGQPAATDLLHSRWAEKVSVVPAEEAASAPAGQKPIILTTKGQTPEQLISLACGSGKRHIVQDSAHMEAELNTAALMSVEPETFLAHPLSSILVPTEAGAAREAELTGLRIEFRSLKERKEIRENITEYLDQIACPSSLSMDILLIVDEITTNAIYNAPYQIRSDDTSPGIPRTEANDTIPGNLSAVLFMGKLDNRLVIGCRDPFGSLEPSRLLERIEKCHTDGLGQSIRWGQGGAGIGSALVYERSASYYVGVNPSNTTVICSQVSLQKSERLRSLIPKSIHWFDMAE